MKGVNIIKIKEGKILPGVQDSIFKTIMTSNKRYLSGIISGITGMDEDEVYENLVIKNSEFPVINAGEKRRTSDLVVEVKDRIINIEMNRFYYEKLYKRNSHYLYKIANLYENEKDTFIQINLDNFNRTKNIITKYQMMSVEDFNRDESIIKYRVNLALIKEKYYNGYELTTLEKRLLLLVLDDVEELKKLSEGDMLMEEINDKLVFLSDEKMVELEYDLDEKIRYEATQVGLEQGREEGFKQGVQEGIEQGIEQEKIKLVKKMIKLDFDSDYISEITEVPIEKIEELKTEEN